MGSAPQNRRDHTIELIDKVVNVLEVLRHAPDGLSLGDISAQTGYVRSSVHRILASLKKHSYVEQEYAGGAYRLGVQVLLLARAMKNSSSLVQLARPYLERLVASCQETAYLAVIRGGRPVFIDVAETHRDLRLVGPMSAEIHYHATAAGKVIAAYLTAEEQDTILSDLNVQPLTDRTLVSEADIRSSWAEVRRLGYAFNDEETIPGAVFIAAPLFAGEERICGAISIGMPKSRYSHDVLQCVVPELTAACAALSARISATSSVCAPWTAQWTLDVAARQIKNAPDVG